MLFVHKDDESMGKLLDALVCGIQIIQNCIPELKKHTNRLNSFNTKIWFE